MDNVWIKIVGVIIVIVLLYAGFTWIRSEIKQAQNPETTFSDMVEKDERELLAEPNIKDLENRASEPNQTTPSIQPSQPVTREPVTFYFTEVDEMEQIEAEQLLAMIPTGRSMGRLPMTGFKLMVETCRQIMSRWPGSIYDYKARRALNQMPERYRERYQITEEELDLTRFTEPRPNTNPYTIKEED